MSLSSRNKAWLLQLAQESIEHGLDQGGPLTQISNAPDTLLVRCASFVTLETHNQLRGCIGSIEAYRPLAEDVANNAYGAAFRDTRFAPLQPGELPDLHIQISVLTNPEPIHAATEQDLLQQLIPGEDGVLLEDGLHRATFLPQVWEQLPSPHLFLAHLKEKAGLPSNYWSSSLHFHLYRVEKFS